MTKKVGDLSVDELCELIRGEIEETPKTYLENSLHKMVAEVVDHVCGINTPMIIERATRKVAEHFFEIDSEDIGQVREIRQTIGYMREKRLNSESDKKAARNSAIRWIVVTVLTLLAAALLGGKLNV